MKIDVAGHCLTSVFSKMALTESKASMNLTKNDFTILLRPP